MKNLFKSVVVYLATLESRAVLKKYEPKIVAITGTVGKTSTKDAIYTALAQSLSVRKTKKSFNSEIGIPLTILGCGNPATSITGWIDVLLEGLKLLLMPTHYPEWLVLEVGTDRPGDIQEVTQWLKPDVVVVTKLSKVPVHVEFFSSVEQVIHEKGNLVRALKKGGVLVLNADDDDVMNYQKLTDGKVLTFGNSSDANLRAGAYRVVYEHNHPIGISFDVVHELENLTYPVLLKGSLGKHLVNPVLAALAVTEAVKEDAAHAAKAFNDHEPTPGRMRLIEGIHGSTIIDDTYNSSPVALVEALKTLKDVAHSARKIAVLGDMLELGKFSIDEHKKAGILAKDSADMFFAVGPRMKYAAESARSAGMEFVYEFNDSETAGEFLKEQVQSGDTILAKGSQGVRIERVVGALMLHPEDKERLLVRQDREWQERDQKRK